MEVWDKREWLEKIKNAVCLMAVLLGLMLCLTEFMDRNVPVMVLICNAAGIALVLVLLEQVKSWRKYILAILALLCVLEFGGCYRELQQGFLGCLNQVTAMLNQYYNIEIKALPWNGKQELADYFFRMFLIGLGSLEGLVLYLAGKKRRCGPGLVLPVLLWSGIVLTGRRPSFAGVLLITVGAAVRNLDLKQPGAWKAFTGMGLLFTAAAVFAGSPKAERLIEEKHDPWQERQWQAEEAVWTYIQSFMPKEEKSGRVEKVRYGYQKPQRSGRVMFEITLSEYPKEPVYLRGFVGGIYKNGNWQAVPRDTFQEFMENAGYEAEDYAKWLMYRNYKRRFEAEVLGDRKPVNVHIKMAGNPRNYMLLPYDTNLPKEVEVWDDGTVSPSPQREYWYQSYLYDELQVENAAKDDTLFLLGAIKNSYSTQNEKWEAYQRYVDANYKAVPKGLEELEQFASDSAELKSVEMIPKLLAQQAAYSLNLEPLPEGEEFAEDFLFRQKKGYCVQFATAGTLLLRMYGIPSRYVSGYCIQPEDFRQNPDGRTYTAEVTDKRAHAWSEAFDSEKGFYPVEMTPPSVFEEEMPEAETQKQKKEEQPKQKTKTKTQKKQQVKKTQAPEQPGKFQWKTTAAAIALLVFLPPGGLVLRRRKIKKKRDRRMCQENRSQGALAVGAEVFGLLKAAGYPKKKSMTELEYARMLQEKIPLANPESWLQFMELLQKAAFSGRPLSEEEWHNTWELYQELKRIVESRQKKWQRFWWKYIRICG